MIKKKKKKRELESDEIEDAQKTQSLLETLNMSFLLIQTKYGLQCVNFQSHSCRP